MVNAKICKKCGSDEMVPRKNARCRLGYRFVCNPCHREWQRKDREQNPERYKEYACKQREQQPEAVRAARRKYSEQNREAERERSRKYREQNPEVCKMWGVRRRARKREVVNTLTAAEWRGIQQRFNHRCAYCGERKKLSMDHVTPLNDFGPTTAQNIVPACISCNSKKNTGPPPVPVQTLLFA